MNSCNEILMDDIVRIDFYDMNKPLAIVRSIPFSVPSVTNMTVMQGQIDLGHPYNDQGERLDEPVLSLDFNGATAALMGTPKHSAPQKNEAAGRIYAHVLTVPVELGFDAVCQANYALKGKEVLCVLTTYDNTRKCIHALPCSTELTYDDDGGSGHRATIKYVAQSRSQLVVISQAEDSSSSSE